MSDLIDVNLPQNEIDQQPLSTIDNIKIYFDNYIKNFVPYKDEPVYKAFIEFFLKHYINILYDVQPSEFKQLFEEQSIPNSIIDILLISIGLPQNVINEITLTSKLTILKTMSDFERYKGTIKFIRTLAGNLNDKISYYELYIDYDKNYNNIPGSYLVIIDKNKIYNNSYFLIDSIDEQYYIWFNINGQGNNPNLAGKIGIEIEFNSRYDTNKSIAMKILTALNLTPDFNVKINTTDMLEINLVKSGEISGFQAGTTDLKYFILNDPKKTGAWVLLPRPIYIHKSMEQNTSKILYKEAYEKIPNLLISEEQLSNLYKQNDIVLPIKTNILLLDYASNNENSVLNNLFFPIILQDIGDDYFSLYLTNEASLNITYKNFIFYWFYLIQRFYGVTLENLKLMNAIIMGSGKTTEYSINDLPDIEKEYNNIKSRPELIDFYNKYILKEFASSINNQKITLYGLKETAKKIDINLYNYIENRLKSTEDVNLEIQLILDELYASFVLSFKKYDNDPILSKYLPFLLESISYLSTDIKNTDSYKIIYNLKPFHTDLLDLSSNNVIFGNDQDGISDKFNSLLLSTIPEFIYYHNLVSVHNISDQINSFFKTSSCDSISLISLFYISFLTITKYFINDKTIFKYNYNNEKNTDLLFPKYDKYISGWDYDYGLNYSGYDYFEKNNKYDKLIFNNTYNNKSNISFNDLFEVSIT